MKARAKEPVTLALGVRGQARRLVDARMLRRLRARFAKALVATAVPGAALSVVLTDDVEIRELNRSYRGKDRPTDVLSFSMREGERPRSGAAERLLGDVVLSVETARRIRHVPGFDLEDELLFLYAHGLCHLLGYDHRTDAEEAVMNARADELRAAAGSRRRRSGAH